MKTWVEHLAKAVNIYNSTPNVFGYSAMYLAMSISIKQDEFRKALASEFNSNAINEDTNKARDLVYVRLHELDAIKTSRDENNDFK